MSKVSQKWQLTVHSYVCFISILKRSFVKNKMEESVKASCHYYSDDTTVIFKNKDQWKFRLLIYTGCFTTDEF